MVASFLRQMLEQRGAELVHRRAPAAVGGRPAPTVLTESTIARYQPSSRATPIRPPLLSSMPRLTATTAAARGPASVERSSASDPRGDGVE